MDFIVKFAIYGARRLPKTDRLSLIDPYLVLTITELNGPDKEVKYKTKVIDNNDNPDWNEAFLFISKKGENKRFHGDIRIDVYDENPLKDSYVGFASLNLLDIPPEKATKVELPLILTKEKYVKQNLDSKIIIGIQGTVLTYASLRQVCATIPRAVFEDQKHHVYVPIQEFGGHLYVAVEYEYKGTLPVALDVKLYTTVPNAPLFVDMAVVGRECTKLKRRSYPAGQLLIPGIVVYEEIKLDDISISTNFDQLLVFCFEKTVLGKVNLGNIAKEHGWKGKLGYNEAKQVLKDIVVDDKEQEVYMAVDAERDCMLVVDYDKEDVDIKLGVLALPSTADKAYDLIADGACTRHSRVYLPPISKLNLSFTRFFELDDVAYGSSLSTMHVLKYQVFNPRQFTLQSIVPVMGH